MVWHGIYMALWHLVGSAILAQFPGPGGWDARTPWGAPRASQADFRWFSDNSDVIWCDVMMMINDDDGDDDDDDQLWIIVVMMMMMMKCGVSRCWNMLEGLPTAFIVDILWDGRVRRTGLWNTSEPPRSEQVWTIRSPGLMQLSNANGFGRQLQWM